MAPAAIRKLSSTAHWLPGATGVWIPRPWHWARNPAGPKRVERLSLKRDAHALTVAIIDVDMAARSGRVASQSTAHLPARL